jgi:hypothetical protein
MHVCKGCWGLGEAVSWQTQEVHGANWQLYVWVSLADGWSEAATGQGWPSALRGSPCVPSC